MPQTIQKEEEQFKLYEKNRPEIEEKNRPKFIVPNNL